MPVLSYTFWINPEGLFHSNQAVGSMKTLTVMGYRGGIVALALLFTTWGMAFAGNDAKPSMSHQSKPSRTEAVSLYRQPAVVPVYPAGLRKMRLNCATVHVMADKTTGAFTVKCEVESNEVAARTEFVKVTPLSNVQDLAVDFPQVQPQKGSSVEVEASGKLAPEEDSGVFILSICNADGVEEDRAVIRVRRAP